MRGEAIKGHLDLLLLSVLSAGPLHGYGVIEALKSRSRDAFQLPEGTIYPALHRLEREGYVESRWGVGDTSRRRRIYSLTRQGMGKLAERQADWTGFRNAVNLVVGEAP